MINQLTIWTPPPEIAAQLIHFLLHAYVEAPLTTACLILVPRVLQIRWSGMSNLIRTVGIYQRAVIPFVCHSLLTIPVVLVHIPFHVRQFPIPRLDPSSSTAGQRLHQAAATSLRGMLETLDAN